MSQNNHAQGQGSPGSPGKRSARERLRQDREKEQAAQRRRRVYLVAGAALAVLAIAAAAGLIAGGQDGDDSADGATAQPVTVGEKRAPATLTVYEDFRCPACGQFESTFRDTVHELTDAGKLRVDYHLVSIIDGNMGGSGSHQAANAAACARDAGRFTEYHDVLYAHQPAETDDAFADTDHLLDLAGKVKGLDSETFRTCVTSDEHSGWVERSNSDFLDSEHNATPTVLLNGEDVYDSLTPQWLRERVNDLAG